MTRDQIIALICRVADAMDLDRIELLGGAVAESALNPQARRPQDPSQDQSYWPDVSFGLFQQTARFATEGDQSPRADNIRFIQELYFDPEHAARVAAGKFKAYRATEQAPLDAWCRYNWPAKTPADNPNRANYANGLAEAAKILGAAPMADVTAIQQRVIEWGKARTGKPYAGPLSDYPQSDRFGGPGPHDGYDCSSFVSEAYRIVTNGAIKLTAYTDAAYDQCEWVQQPQPGDLVFYHYGDASQSGVKFPHVGVWLSTTEVLDCRYPMGVGVHPHVTPVGPMPDGRYRQTMRPKGLASVVIAPAPVPTVDPRDAQIASLQAQLKEARTKLGVASVDYVRGLRDLADALEKLKPAA